MAQLAPNQPVGNIPQNANPNGVRRRSESAGTPSSAGAASPRRSEDAGTPSPGAQNPRSGDVAVVDDEVGGRQRIHLGLVDRLGGVLPVPVHALRLGSALPHRVPRDAPAQRLAGADLKPDAVVPELVVLRPE